MLFRSEPKRGEITADDIGSTLLAQKQNDIVVFDARGNGDGKIVPTLKSVMSGSNTVPDVAYLLKRMRRYIVRRLTPLECCRLQGFPDWWEDSVDGSDSARYKMWGNGMALPCVLYVMEGIVDEM